MAGAHLGLAEHQRGIHPRTFDGLFHLRRQVGDRRRATGQAVEGRRQVTGQYGRVDAVMADQSQQVRVGQLQDLLQPVHQLHIGIAAQLAEHGAAFNRPVAQAVEFAEKREATDISHGQVLEG